MIAEHKLDAIVSPSTGAGWSIAAVAGYPSVTVPAGFVGGMPQGILFIGRPFDDGRLIKYAYAFEQMTKARRKPEFLPKRPAQAP